MLDKICGKSWKVRFLVMLSVSIFMRCDVAFCATVDSVDSLYDVLNIEDESITFDVLGIVEECTISETDEEYIKGSILNDFYYSSDFSYLVLCADEIYDSNPSFSYAGDGKVVVRNYFIFECATACSYNFGVKNGYYFVNFDKVPCDFMSQAKSFTIAYLDYEYPIQITGEYTPLYWDLVSVPETCFELFEVGSDCELDFDVLYRDSNFTFDSSLVANSDSGTSGSDSGISGSDSGTSGSDSGTSGSDSGTSGSDSGTSGSDSGTSGSGSGTSGSDSGTSGSGSGTSGSDSGTDDVDTENMSLYEQAAEKIKEVFPFCIPFDIYKALKCMHSTAVAPVWEVELEFPSIDFTFYFKVDMADFESAVYVLRWGIFLLFVVGLMAGTYKLIKWEKG